MNWLMKLVTHYTCELIVRNANEPFNKVRIEMQFYSSSGRGGRSCDRSDIGGVEGNRGKC